MAPSTPYIKVVAGKLPQSILVIYNNIFFIRVNQSRYDTRYGDIGTTRLRCTDTCTVYLLARRYIL